MSSKKSIDWGGIGLLALIVFLIVTAYWSGRDHGLIACKKQWNLDSVKTSVDSSKYHETLKPVKPDTVYRDKYVLLGKPFDTLAWVEDYLSTKEYTFKSEQSETRITARPFISLNKVDSLQLTVQNLRPSEQYFFSQLPKNMLYVNALAGPDMAAIGLSFQRNRWQFGAQYNLISQAPQQWVFSVNYKILDW